MPIYTIKKVYLYSVIVEVEAENESEAEDKATMIEGERVYDDYLYDYRVINKR
jgi:hypothetical protein